MSDKPESFPRLRLEPSVGKSPLPVAKPLVAPQAPANPAPAPASPAIVVNVGPKSKPADEKPVIAPRESARPEPVKIEAAAKPAVAKPLAIVTGAPVKADAPSASRKAVRKKGRTQVPTYLIVVGSVAGVGLAMIIGLVVTLGLWLTSGGSPRTASKKHPSGLTPAQHKERLDSFAEMGRTATWPAAPAKPAAPSKKK